jgi:hypothetical protein
VRALVRGGQSETGSSILEELCRVALGELGMWGVVISLMTPGERGRDQAGTIEAASSEPARAVEELEFTLGEGPGTDAFVASHPILTPDLELALDRWPGYAPAAYAAGVRATFAFPMLVGAARFGVLHLHSAEVRHLTSRDTATSLMLTELAMEAVLDTYATDGNSVPTDLPHSPRHGRRDEIYQAQGMVMVQLEITLEQALARMRGHAFAGGQELADLAADILAGRVALQPDPDGAP